MFWCFHVVMTISSGSREPAQFKPPGYKLTDMGILKKKKKKHASTLPAHAQTHSYIPHIYTHAASWLPAVLFSPLICWVSWSPLRLLAFPLLDIREQGRRCRGGEYDGREGVCREEKILSGANSQSFVVAPVRNHLAGKEKNGRAMTWHWVHSVLKSLSLTFWICPVSFAFPSSRRARESVCAGVNANKKEHLKGNATNFTKSVYRTRVQRRHNSYIVSHRAVWGNVEDMKIKNKSNR